MRKKWWALLLTGALVIGIGSYAVFSGEKQQGVSSTMAKAEKGDLESKILTSGIVKDRDEFTKWSDWT
ncbi:hypothetical protein [Brevibacillus laterosporus]|uniref:hypothetical protein n=1 Tax=Brevibacillus laterosporus TaxID=1465 RepID=UPI000B9BA45B|nr:hypothetical protein [Brevibacillus laterosporus]MBG9789377.1 hypothetical protein [Brevibacillus laterosporus]MCG7317212.1 hypothetical protein [Brevibacillus laterosporus]